MTEEDKKIELLCIVISDLHLGPGVVKGEFNPFEDFLHDDRFAELLQYYDTVVGEEIETELILNGDIFDLLHIKVDDVWPSKITPDIAVEKLRQCLDGHPIFVSALRQFVSKGKRRVVFIPGNHDLEMWFPTSQQLLRHHVTPDLPNDRIHFVTDSDTYDLPGRVQIRHGHQFERIHKVDYSRMTCKGNDKVEILDHPWGNQWIIDVVTPAKKRRNYVDRILPFRRFILASLLFDTFFALGFITRTVLHFLRHRIFTTHAWVQRLRRLPRILREEIFTIGDQHEAAIRTLLDPLGPRILVVGHSHIPRFQSLHSGKILINTGTWIKMINLDLHHLGQDSGLTYGLIEYTGDGQPRARLMRWYGRWQPLCETIPHAE